jgi:uncharacterized protein (DUF3084 family)
MNNKIYFFVTVACLLVFGVVYHQFDSGYEAHLAAVKKAADDEKKVAAARDVEVRAKAIKDAVVAQEKRKAEQAALEQQEEARKVARQEAEDARAKAFDERRRVRDQAERLKKEVDTVAAEVAKAREQKTQLEQEKVFLTEAVAQVRTNAKSFQDLLLKLDSAESVKPATRTAQN